MVAQSATDQAHARLWANMKAVRACFMAAVSAIVGAIPEVVGAVGAQSLSKINDLQSMSDRFIGGYPVFAALQHANPCISRCCSAAWGGVAGAWDS